MSDKDVIARVSSGEFVASIATVEFSTQGRVLGRAGETGSAEPEQYTNYGIAQTLVTDSSRLPEHSSFLTQARNAFLLVYFQPDDFSSWPLRIRAVANKPHLDASVGNLATIPLVADGAPFDSPSASDRGPTRTCVDHSA